MGDVRIAYRAQRDEEPASRVEEEGGVCVLVSSTREEIVNSFASLPDENATHKFALSEWSLLLHDQIFRLGSDRPLPSLL